MGFVEPYSCEAVHKSSTAKQIGRSY